MASKTVFNLGALGDSISVAYNADRLGANHAASWTTGHDLPQAGASHFQRIQQTFPEFLVRQQNEAFNGARATDLAVQVERLLSNVTPDYVTLLVGANDLVRWVTGNYDPHLDQFRRDVRLSIDRLIRANRHMMVLLVSIPDQSRLIEVLKRKFLGASGRSPLIDLVQSSFADEMVQKFRERFIRMNQSLEEICHNFSGNARFAASVSAHRFDGEHISTIDHYHPSPVGQRLLAELAWNDGFFPG
jgi:lysophospholipase L1-like esterase